MRQWLPYRDRFLNLLLDLEGPALETRDCVDCGAQHSPWRCIDCVDRAMLCTSCCKKRHKHDYLHRVERWSCAIASPNVALGGEEEDGEPDSEDWVPEELASEPIASEPIASVHGESKAVTRWPLVLTCPIRLLRNQFPV